VDWSKFYFSNSHFPVTIHGLDLVSGVYLNKLLCLWCAIVDSSSISEYPWLGVSLPENRNTAGFWNITILLKIRWRTNTPTTPKNCQLTSVMLCSPFWISSPKNMGLIGCLQISVTDYHSMLHIPQQCRSHKTIWWYRSWFAFTCSIQSDPVCNLYANLRQSHICKHQI